MANRAFMGSGKVAMLLAAAALVLTPTIAIAAGERRAKPPAVSVSFDRIGSFTPASADPRLAALFANRDTPAADFRFTPPAPKGRPSQLRVAVRTGGMAMTPARPVEVAVASTVAALAPTKYDLGVSVGWRRLQLSGDVGKTLSPDPVLGNRETAIVGVSYNLKKFTGRVAVAGERNEARVAPLARPDSMLVDVGGAFNISRNIALTGGVRYKVERDQIPALAADRRDSKAVYVGTAVRF